MREDILTQLCRIKGAAYFQSDTLHGVRAKTVSNCRIKSQELLVHSLCKFTGSGTLSDILTKPKSALSVAEINLL